MNVDWAARLRQFLPGFCESHLGLKGLLPKASVILYGSTAMGVDDAWSDLDLWMVLPDADLADLDSASGTRFFELELDGKKGHIVAESTEEMLARVNGCHMDTIYQLRSAEVLTDAAGVGQELVRMARLPMRKEVRDAFFFYHYVEMRGEHPACVGPMNRGDPVALLLSFPKMLAHGLRAAMVLDGEPYPYDKWLYRSACRTATGGLLAPYVNRVIGHLAGDALRFVGPRMEHPIEIELRAIREKLIETARAHGCDAPWLTKWWFHMNKARDAVEGIRWRTGPVQPQANA